MPKNDAVGPVAAHGTAGEFINIKIPDEATVLGVPEAHVDQLAGFSAVDKAQIASASGKLKEILREMETVEGLAKLKSGEMDFKIKPETGVRWYVAYGT